MDRTYTIFIKHSNYYIACVFVINFEFHWLIGCICKDVMNLDSPGDAQCVEVTACGAKAHVIKVAQCVVLNPCTCRGLERVYLKLIGTNDRQWNCEIKLCGSSNDLLQSVSAHKLIFQTLFQDYMSVIIQKRSTINSSIKIYTRRFKKKWYKPQIRWSQFKPCINRRYIHMYTAKQLKTIHYSLNN